jgi:ATP-dependent Clp protease ATP-binding subunit ClpB
MLRFSGDRSEFRHFTERDRLEKIKEAKKKLEEAKYQLEVAQRQGQFELASRLRYATIPELERQLPTEKEQEEKEESPLAMLHDRVTSNDIARVVAKATGVPVQNLMKGERDKLVRVRNSVIILCTLMLRFIYRWKKRCGSEL